MNFTITILSTARRSNNKKQVPLGRLTLVNRKSSLKAREGLFFLSNPRIYFCVILRDLV